MDNTLTQRGAPRPLSELLEDAQAWPLEQSLRLVHRLAFQVRALHESGQTHRSIDIHSVTVDDQLQPKLPAGPPKRRFGGTDSDPEFCPPELAEGEGLELPGSIEAAVRLLTSYGREFEPRRIDIYQLGTLLCRLLTGETIHAYMFRPKVKSQLPPVAQSLLERSLGYDCENRFGTCDQLLEALDEALRDSGAEPAGSFTQATPACGSVLNIAGDTPPEGHRAPSSSGVVPQAAEGLPFQRLGRYAIVGRIGSGGMGDVYRGYDESLDRTVAIKVLPADLAKHEDFVQRFHAEATAAAKLAHPNVVPIFSIDEDAGHHFFAMQYVEGESLAVRLGREKRLPLEEAIRIVEQCLAGLEAAHRAGLIHRDIKPANILVDAATGRALLVDFGLVRRMGQGDRLTATGVIMGTVDYIAPEQARGLDVDGRADLYAVGVLFYQMLAGRLPFEAETPTSMMFRHAYEAPRPLQDLASDVPAPVAAIVARMMAKDPQDRYQSAREVLDDLSAFRDRRPVGALTAETGEDWPAAGLPPEPTLPERWEALAGEGPWQRARDWAATMFRRHAPQRLQELQSTTQQIDLAVGYEERQGRRLEDLLSEGRSVLAELTVQLQSNREAAAEMAAKASSASAGEEREAILARKRLLDEDVASIEARHAEQKRQVEDIELQLDKTRASMTRLRSQRDLLYARLKAAQIGLQPASTGPKRVVFLAGARIAVAIAAICLVILAAVLVRLGMRSVRPDGMTASEAPNAQTNIPRDREPDTVISRTEPAGQSAPIPFHAYVPKADKEQVPLAGPAADLTAGGGGRYLILRLAGKRKLVVFDVSQGKVAQELPLREEVVHFAATEQRLVIVNPIAKLIEIWSLATLERVRSVLLPSTLTSDSIHQVAMGWASAGPLFIYLPGQKRTWALDLNSMKTTEVHWSQWGPSNAYGPLNMRVSPDGTMLIGWGGGWAGCEAATFSGGLQTGLHGIGPLCALDGTFALPSADARFIYTSQGITNRGFGPLNGPLGNIVPAVEPGYFLSLRSAPRNARAGGEATVYTEDRKLLFFLKDLDELNTQADLLWEKRVYYYPRAGLLVTLGAEKDRILLRRVDLMEQLEKSGADFLVVLSQPPAATAGAVFSYRLDVRSKKGGVTVKLESGPPGLTVTPQGQVHWDVPRNPTEPEVEVLVTVRDASGAETLHTFTIRIVTGRIL